MSVKAFAQRVIAVGLGSLEPMERAAFLIALTEGAADGLKVILGAERAAEHLYGLADHIITKETR